MCSYENQEIAGRLHRYTREHLSNPHPLLDTLRDQRPFFDEQEMKPPSRQYVCWIDVMGSQSSMQRSLSMAANFVMKLHVAALDVAAGYPAISLYPVIDGLYVCATGKGPILGFLKDVFFKLALTFVLENQRRFRFCIRAGLAFGPIVIGNDVTNCSNVLSTNVEYCRRILLGITLSQAYNAAGNAAPFGIALHESARAFAPPNAEPMFEAHLKWWELIADQDLSRQLVDSLKEALKDYHQWCDRHAETCNMTGKGESLTKSW